MDDAILVRHFVRKTQELSEAHISGCVITKGNIIVGTGSSETQCAFLAARDDSVKHGLPSLQGCKIYMSREPNSETLETMVSSGIAHVHVANSKCVSSEPTTPGLPHVRIVVSLSADGSVIEDTPEVEREKQCERLSCQATLHGSRCTVKRNTSVLQAVLGNQQPGFDANTVFFPRIENETHVDPRRVLGFLAQFRGVEKCIVEGGPTLQSVMVKLGLVHEIVVYETTTIVGKHAQPWSAYLPGGLYLKLMRVRKCSPTLLCKTYAVTQKVFLEHNSLSASHTRHANVQAALGMGKLVISISSTASFLLCVPAHFNVDHARFYKSHTHGILEVDVTKECASRLAIPWSSTFRISCDAAATVAHPASLAGQVETVQMLCDAQSGTRDIRFPGHVFVEVSTSSEPMVHALLLGVDGSLMDEEDSMAFALAHDLKWMMASDAVK